MLLRLVPVFLPYDFSQPRCRLCAIVSLLETTLPVRFSNIQRIARRRNWTEQHHRQASGPEIRWVQGTATVEEVVFAGSGNFRLADNPGIIQSPELFV
jgi:hypothetical protein